MNLEGRVINFLGDSFTEAGGATSLEYGFVAVMEREYLLAKARNYGVCGTCIAKRLRPYGIKEQDESWWEDFVTRAKRMDHNADAVVVLGGTNDYGHGDVPIGSLTDKDTTFCGQFNVLCDILLQNYRGKPILIVTPTPRGDISGPVGDGGRNFATGELSEYVSAMIAIANNKGLTVLNLFDDPQFALGQELDVLCHDQLHPSNYGHRLLAKKIAEQLQKM